MTMNRPPSSKPILYAFLLVAALTLIFGLAVALRVKPAEPKMNPEKAAQTNTVPR